MQPITDVARALTTTDIGVIGIFTLLLLKEIEKLIQKTKNGKDDDSTREYKILHPCKFDPGVIRAIQASERSEKAHEKMSEGISTLVSEAKLQTQILNQIEKNGKSLH